MNEETIQFSLIQTIVLWVIPLLFAITAHEASHGYVANKLGDPTAKMLGRLTLNPFKHIDLFGTIILPVLTLWLGGFVFGWAKPVPITWRNLKKLRRDIALVALAGPLSNLLMALMWGVVTKGGQYLESQHIIYGVVLSTMGKIGIQVNCILCVLNLLPIQPLDGGRIMSSLLPGKASYYFDRLEPYGIFILLFLMATKILGMILIPPFTFLINIIYSLLGLQ
jgi:Zn-dependent protease